MYSIKKLYKIGNGPSSSHTMGPKNAVRYILKYYPGASFYEMTLYGSLALTGKGHLADIVIEDTFKDIPHKVIFDTETKIKGHPNTMIFKVHYGDKIKIIKIVSIGGGILDVIGEKKKYYNNCYPHQHFSDIKKYCLDNNLTLIEYIDKFDEKDLREYMENIYSTMMKVVDDGLKKTGYLPGTLHIERKAQAIFNKGVPEENYSRREKRLVSAYAFAAAEENASGSVVVTAPTCGASGIMPSLAKHFGEHGYSHQKIIEGLMVAGLIGLIVKHNASISGAECGCQAEIGTAISMGAAFVSYIRGGDIETIERAAEIGMEHILGLTCDPIDGYVQVPCIERNALGALRAIEAASITDFMDSTSSKISFDLVVDTMYETGKDMAKKYRETSLGGLAEKYKEIEEEK